MHEAMTYGEWLDAERDGLIQQLLLRAEITVLSCLFWRMDRRSMVSHGRILPDDYVVVPVEGAVDFTAGGVTRRLGPGQVVMVLAGMPHGADLAADSARFETYGLHLHALDSHGQSWFHRLSTPFGEVRGVESWFDRLRLCTYLTQKHPASGRGYGRELVRDMLIEQILHGAGLRAAPQQMDYRIVRAVDAMRRNLDRDLRIERLAADSGISARRFRQLFREAVGVSPKQYLRRARLSHARSLLSTDPSLTVQEVAYQSGFNDPHNFHALYRRTYGETPGETRRSFLRGSTSAG